MKHLIVLLAVSVSLSANAQIEVKTEVSKDAVMINEPFKIEFTVNQNFQDFNLTKDENFEIVSGPSTSFQQSISITNGKAEKNTTITYTYLLKAKNPGKQNLPVAEIKIHGKYYYSDQKDIIVIDAVYHNPKETETKDIEGTSKL